jgi:hypothetical protein
VMKADKEFAARVKQDERLQSIRVLLTNGHNWRLYEFDLEYTSKATHMYRPRSVDEVIAETGERPVFKFVGDRSAKKIWSDLRQLQIALGLVRFSLGVRTEGEQKLQEVYDYLNDLQSGDIMTEEERKEIENREKKSRSLPKFLRKLYVGNDFYLEEVENEKKALKNQQEQIGLENEENTNKTK